MTVFKSHYAGQYDQFYSEKDYSGECDLIEEAVRRYAAHAPKSVLDIGCGTGGHAIELAGRGYRVTGVDLSQAMLDVATRKCAGLSLAGGTPQWLCGDAKDFESGREHDLGVMMFAVIGYLAENADILKSLRNIRRQLKRGALFICDFWYGPTVLTMGPSDRIRVFESNEGKTIRSASTKLDVVRHTADVTIGLWTLAGDRLVGESTEIHRLRYFFPQEFSMLLSVAGFRSVGISAFPSIDAQPDINTWNALSIAVAD